MKLNSLITACGIAAAALLASCSGSPSGKSLEQVNPGNASDSASYYYGQIMAGRMAQMVANDSIYKDAKLRDLYWEGMRKALSLLREGDTPEARAYNEGIQLGLQLAGDMNQISNDIPEFKFNKKIFEEGYAYSFTPDSAKGVNDASFGLEKIMNALNDRAMAEKKQAMEKNMAAYAAKNGFTKNAQGFYMKVAKKGEGPKIEVGDSLLFGVEFATNKNKDMKQYNMPPTGIVLGKTMPMEYPTAKSLVGVNGGSVIMILISPDELFGGASKQFKFAADEFLIMTATPEFKGKTSFKLSEAKSVPELKAGKK